MRSSTRLVKLALATFLGTAVFVDAWNTSLDILAAGNQAFRTNIAQTDPGLLEQLTINGQHPPFMYFGCSDSRVSEGTVFDALPGTLFTERNIANQFLPNDNNVKSVLGYGVATLGVTHIIVMGHYGCGGVGLAITSPPSPPIDAATAAVQNWVAPIRELYLTSNRSEIVQLRNQNQQLKSVPEPDVNDPGYRALVEENVKINVGRIVDASIIRNQFYLVSNENGAPVFIHGFVYDIATGVVSNLGISVGPPGVPIPSIPFPSVA
jgi:carbonic anhydrase